MRSRYVVVMGTCLAIIYFGCSSDDSSSTTAGSGGSATTTTSTGGGKGGSGGSATTTTGGAAGTTTGGAAGSAGSGGSTGGSGTADASSDGNTSCNSACDCPAGNGCFDNKCSTEFFAFCCGSEPCTRFSDALCQRPDKSYSTCGGASDGGKDANVSDFCTFFSCASGQLCPTGCKCGMNDTCVHM